MRLFNWKKLYPWAAVVVGSIVEAIYLAMLYIRLPDPPMDALDVIVIGLQFPGLLIAEALRGGFKFSTTTPEGVLLLFCCQAPFYILLSYFLLKRKFRNRAIS